MKNSELVEAENGFLIVTNTGQVAPPKTTTVVTDSLLNLSMKEQKTHYYVPHSDIDSGYTYSSQSNQDHSTAVNLVKRVPEKIKVETNYVPLIQYPSPFSKDNKTSPQNCSHTMMAAGNPSNDRCPATYFYSSTSGLVGKWLYDHYLKLMNNCVR